MMLVMRNEQRRDRMEIAQMHSVIFKGESISNVIRTLHEINKSQGWGSNLIADLFSEIEGVPVLASSDYDKSPLVQRYSYLFSRFIRLDRKFTYLKMYLNARKNYKSGLARSIMDKADVRIWHYGAFYNLFRYFHAGDILFYYGITYPYLSYFSEFNIYSKNMLQATLDMNPLVIVESQFIKQSLIDLGFKADSIRVLPLFHKYNLPYCKREPVVKPKPIAWGRYALNKGIPELVRVCNEHNLPIRIFGDNIQINEFSSQYKEALERNTRGYAKLSGKVDDFEVELNNANIYVCNSYHEGFNMPLIEAEAHSMPVIARRSTAMDELVKDGYNGYLFSNINEVPELIDRIINNYTKMSKNAWKHSQNYTYEKFKKRYLKILEEYNKR